jgi:hypothetical protein
MGKYKFPPGTWVERELFESKAFLALRGVSPQVLILLLGKRQFRKIGGKGKRQKMVCSNCDSIHLTYIEAWEKYGISKPRFARAIDELLAKGFISIKHKGGTFKNDKSIYALSDNWCLWRPGSVFETREKDTVQRGFCKPKGVKKPKEKYTQDELRKQLADKVLLASDIKKLTHESVPLHSHENVPIKKVLGLRKRTHKI